MFIIMFLFLFNCNALELKDLSIWTTKSVGTNRDWTIPPGEQKKGELGMDLGVKYYDFYLDNQVKSMYTNKQFRYIGLESEFGYSFDKVDIFIRHASEHSLDRPYGTIEKYPNQNDIGIRFKLFKETAE